MGDQAFTVLVTGDAFLAWDIVHKTGDPNTKSGYEPRERANVYRQSGDAWHMTNILKEMKDEQGAGWTVRGVRPEPTQASGEATLPHRKLSHAYALWTEFPRHLDDAKNKAVRVKSYIGSEARGDSLPNDWFEPLAENEDPVKLVVASAYGIEDDQANTDQADPRLSKALKGKPWILWKHQTLYKHRGFISTVSPGAKPQKALRSINGRTIAFMKESVLRDGRMRVSRGASWECLAQEAIAAIRGNADLLSFHRVIVSFTEVGVLIVRPRAGTAVLVFDPAENEGTWRARYPGEMVGSTTCLGAALAKCLIEFIERATESDADLDQALEEAAVEGLARMRALHYLGYFGWFDKRVNAANIASVPFDLRGAGTHDRADGTIYNPTTRYLVVPLEDLLAGDTEGAIEPKAGFACVEIKEESLIKGKTILSTGLRPAAKKHSTPGSLNETLLSPNQIPGDIVVRGPDKALALVPRAKYGNLTTTDPAEINALRAIAKLFQSYGDNPGDKPLSIAVFGQPGSGKSFGVTEIAKQLGDKISRTPLTFNLSQFSGPDMLINALHQVRDVALTGTIPLVFWDEFDTSLGDTELGWLRYFLAPMQDGKFQEGQVTHPIGRAIFVFAGGTCTSMKEFFPDTSTEEEKTEKRRIRKIPDFVSRLRGYLDVQGLNPPNKGDEVSDHLKIRRAMMLHQQLKKIPEIATEGQVQISEGMLTAFLEIPEYKHGARSVEAIVRMSTFRGMYRFTASCLPSLEQLNLHVKGEKFLELAVAR